MTPVEQLEADVAREEAELQADLEKTLNHWRELAARLKALKGSLEQAASGGLDLKALGTRVQALALPQLQPGPQAHRSDSLRRDAVTARRAAVADLRAKLPEFTAAVSRLGYKISAEEGAVAQQVDMARAVAKQVAAAARQLEAMGDEPTAIGRITPVKRNQPRVRMQVKIDFTLGNVLYTGFSTNLSDGGLFIATVSRQLKAGAALQLRFTLPGGKPIEAQGVVRWVREVDDNAPDQMPGLGVQFVKLSDAAKAAIVAFVKDREPLSD
jgi:uncharacterized protein (TIGR02266 family)